MLESFHLTAVCPFKLLLIDIDGVMTPGTKTYGEAGIPTAKQFNDRDFTAINRFKASGVKVGFLSADRYVNESMAAVREVDFYYGRPHGNNVIDKPVVLLQLCAQFGLNANEVAYIGDDWFDLETLSLVGYPFCPADAASCVKDFVAQKGYVLQAEGGSGVLDLLFDYIRLEGLRHGMA